MTDKKEHIRHSMKSTAPADCVTEIRIWAARFRIGTWQEEP